jgi:hypothetical protein
LGVPFVDQNKTAESRIAHLNVRRSYEAGRTDATEAIAENWAPAANPPPGPNRSEAFDPIAMIDRLVQDAVAQLKCADIRTDGEFHYFDLRPFDARGGRVALQDLRNLKTNAAGRVIPIHPLLIELGLLDRMNELMDKQEERLFPEWERYVRKDGTRRWSQPLSKSWQYVKKLLKLSRADLTLYSTRHLMADWLDNEAIAQRTRDRILGHASDVRGRDGRKGVLDPQIAAKIEALEPSVVMQMRRSCWRQRTALMPVSSWCSRHTKGLSSWHCSEWRAIQNKTANSYVIEITL